MSDTSGIVFRLWNEFQISRWSRPILAMLMRWETSPLSLSDRCTTTSQMNDLLRFAHVGACFGHPPSFAWKWWISRRRQGQVFTPLAFPGLTMFIVQTNLFAFDRLLDQLLSQNKFGRARAILAGCKGGSVGSYSDSPGIEVKALRSGWKDKDQNYCEFCLSRFGWKDNTIPRQRSKSLFPVKHQCLCF